MKQLGAVAEVWAARATLHLCAMTAVLEAVLEATAANHKHLGNL